MMLAKVHRRGNRKIIAVCDKELVGKKFEEKNLQLDLTSNFFKGEEMSEEDLKSQAKEAYILNLVGERSVGFALKNKFTDEKSIIRIKNIPHAQCVFVRDE